MNTVDEVQHDGIPNTLPPLPHNAAQQARLHCTHGLSRILHTVYVDHYDDQIKRKLKMAARNGFGWLRILPDQRLPYLTVSLEDVFSFLALQSPDAFHLWSEFGHSDFWVGEKKSIVASPSKCTVLDFPLENLGDFFLGPTLTSDMATPRIKNGESWWKHVCFTRHSCKSAS